MDLAAVIIAGLQSAHALLPLIEKKKVGKEEDIKSSRCNTALSLLQHIPLWDCYSCM